MVLRLELSKYHLFPSRNSLSFFMNFDFDKAARPIPRFPAKPAHNKNWQKNHHRVEHSQICGQICSFFHLVSLICQYWMICRENVVMDF